ncbi:TonB-dependent siderophore receptor [Cellvibrio sp. NN19]|uniref:TonB-dependent siderophore receptor n=1 Tax=Cellvibrio chitinivorans TaxID=3102792 RepID=UPI002B406C82|nr:TonB-dependent siderophore receptor [Cellvibrio sp. NN19]
MTNHTPVFTLRCAALQMALAGIIGTSAIATLLPATAFAQGQQQEQQQSFDIPAGSLAAALTQFAAQAGVSLSTNADVTRGLQSQGLQGNYSVSTGFAQLLSGSGWQAVQQANGTFTLQKIPQAEMGKLQAVQVSAAVDYSGVTENTGSYAAKESRSASKLTLDIKETPQSVSVITREQMDKRGLENIEDILNATPGVYTTRLDSERSAYYARGFAITSRQIDGLPMGDNSPRLDNFFFDRIEVIKGATGLMGATGNPSATINMVRKRPTAEFQANLGVSVGRWDHRRLEADVSSALNSSGSIRARAMLADTDEESYMDFYHLDSTVGMIIVEADLGSSTTATLGYQYQENSPTGSTWGAVPYWNSDGSLANMPRNFSLTADWSRIRENDKTLFAELQHEFDNEWLLKGVVTTTESESDWMVAYGGSGFPNPATGTGLSLWTGIWPYSENEKLNLDLYATGPFQLFGRTHELIAGYSGFTSENTNQNVTTDVQYSAQIPDYRVWKGDIPKPTHVKNGSGSVNTTDIYGFYTTARFSLSDPLNLIVGVRLSDYEYEAKNWTATTPKTLNGDPREQDALTPYVGLTFDINQRFTAYASYADMFTPSSRKDRNNNYLAPETGINYELGVKSDWNDGRLLTTLAAFWSEKDDLAVADLEYNLMVQDAIANGASPDDFEVLTAYVASGQGLKVEGFEIEAIGLVTDTWNISYGYTYVNSISSAIASELTNVPQHQMKLATGYTLPGSWWQGAENLSVGGSLNWQSEITNTWGGAPANSVGDGVIEQDAYTLASLYFNYQFTDSISANLNVDNLFDKKYYSNVGFYNGIYWGEPRNVKLSLRARF